MSLVSRPELVMNGLSDHRRTTCLLSSWTASWRGAAAVCLAAAASTAPALLFAPAAPAAPVTYSQVSAGGAHTCAIRTGGAVMCWGFNGYGELGDGSTVAHRAPNPVSAISGATAVTSGRNHSCALVSGAVQCWGERVYGYPVWKDSTVPVSVPGISTATAISAGENHTCALLAGGAVTCWGIGSFGQLGNGAQLDVTAPVSVVGVAGATAISTGDEYSCALLSGGGVACWGLGGAGQLGDGRVMRSLLPVDVAGVSGAVAISSGGATSCALFANGRVKCWGDGSLGQLGNGFAQGIGKTPVDVRGITTARAISVGGFHLRGGRGHVCALLATRTVSCWGSNGGRELGSSDQRQLSATPVPVSGLSGVTAVSSGGAHTCAVLQAGGLACWGANVNGELGAASSDRSIGPPVPVAGTAGPATGTVLRQPPWQVPVRHGTVTVRCAAATGTITTCRATLEYGKLRIAITDGPRGALKLRLNRAGMRHYNIAHTKNQVLSATLTVIARGPSGPATSVSVVRLG